MNHPPEHPMTPAQCYLHALALAQDNDANDADRQAALVYATLATATEAHARASLMIADQRADWYRDNAPKED